jgi:hypothetical protein
MRFEEAYSGWNAGRLTQAEAGQLLGMCERSFRRYLGRYEAQGLEVSIQSRERRFLNECFDYAKTQESNDLRVHRDLTVLSSALQSGHGFVPTLIAIADRLIDEVERRTRS